MNDYLYRAGLIRRLLADLSARHSTKRVISISSEQILQFCFRFRRKARRNSPGRVAFLRNVSSVKAS